MQNEFLNNKSILALFFDPKKCSYVKNKISGIYQIINVVNNKKYIGSSKDLYNRYKSHLKTLIKNMHFNIHLQNAYNKYNCLFVFEVIRSCKIENLLKIEQFYIDLHKDNLYNFSLFVNGFKNCKHNKEQKEKWKDKRKGSQLGILNNFYGKHHKEETKKKLKQTIKENGGHSGEKNGNFGNHIRYMNKDGKNKMVKLDEVESYLKDDWIFGRVKNK